MSLLTATTKGTFGLIRRLPPLLAASTVGWLAYSAIRDRDEPPLPDPFASRPNRLVTLEAGELVVHETQVHTDRSDTTPVVLIHSVNAAASSYEMAPLFQRLERDRFVVSVDLPGFGHSDRSDRQYSPELMADAIAAVLDTFDEPVHLITLSLSGEFAARAARIRPDRVASLTMISPTGMGSGSMVEPRSSGWFETITENSLVGQGLFDLLASDWSIRYFLSRSFATTVDPGLAAFAGLTARQPDARHAPLAFIRGELFTPDALSELYQPLMVPTLVLYDEDAYTDFAYLPEFVADRPNRTARRIPGTRGLPHFDRPALTVDAIETFWKDVESI